MIQAIQRRIFLPGDSETRRSQKTLAMGVMAVSAVSTGLNGLYQYVSGVESIGLTNMGLAALLVVSFFLVLALPRLYTAVAVALLFTTMLSNLLVHYEGGGFTSGLMLITWAILGLAFAVLFVGRRAVLLITAGYIATILAAGWLEPLARSQMPPLAASFVTRTAVTNLLVLGVLSVGASLYLFSQIERYRRRADDLLLNILPAPIAARLKEQPGTIADGYDDVTVLFADIVGFTPLASSVDPVAVVNKLNEVFTEFDELAMKHDLEKIKTIGDAYMVAGGLPEPRPNHCEAVAAFALDMLAVVARHRTWSGDPIRLRIGINCGPVVAGVIGRQKFSYDLWGDAVNVASRMESSGLENQIQVTEAFKERLTGLYDFEPRGLIEVKGKGPMATYLLKRNSEL